MFLLDYEQLSKEWFTERVGNPGASCFDKIVTSTGEKSKQWKQYLYTLAGQAVIGRFEETYQSYAMQRGIETESEARAFFELVQGVEVKKVGIIFPDENKRYHCSPDFTDPEVKEFGGEIKCPLVNTQVEYLLKGKLPTKYIQQIQGSLLVTGFKYWYFLSYYPGLKPLLLKIERDEKFINKLRKALDNFCDELDKTIEKLKAL